MKMSPWIICTILYILVGNINWSQGAPESIEISQHSVNVTFYQMTSSEWESKAGTFQAEVASILSDYCQQNLEMCGLNRWQSSFTFTSEEVLISGTEPMKYSFNVTFYVKYNPAVSAADKNSTEHVVPKSGVEAGLAEYRRRLNVAMDSSILGVNQEPYSPYPSTRLNKIIIPITIAFVVLLIIITIALYYNRKRQDRKDALKEKLDKKKEDKKLRKEERSSPSSSKTPSKVAPAPHSRDVEAGNPPHDMRGSKHRGENDSNYGNQTDDTYVAGFDTKGHRKSLPPLEDAEEGHSRHHKKHKKHKHHKHRHSKNEEDRVDTYRQRGEPDQHPNDYEQDRAPVTATMTFSAAGMGKQHTGAL